MHSIRVLLTILCLTFLAAMVSHAAPATSAGNAPPAANATQATPAPGSALSDADIYKKALPSVVFLDEKTKDGNDYLGSGFMAIKDGIVVTCWHMVHDAKSVTARFSDGEVYDVVGLIDHDAVNDVALVKVKVTGRPLLTLQKDAPEIGAKACLIGAPLGADFTISDGIISQIRHNPYQYQFTCPATHGNSGGPLLDEYGRVIGIDDSGVDQSTASLFFAVPIKYALNLDETLPVKAWSDVVDDTPTDNSDSSGTNSASNDDLDKMIATAYVDADDAQAYLVYVHRLMEQKNGYKDGVPPGLYSFQDSLKRDIDSLSSVTSDDKERENLRSDVLAQAQHIADAADYLSRAILSAGANDGWDTIANDLLSRYVGATNEYKGLSSDETDLILSMQSFANEKNVAYKQLHDLDIYRVGFSWTMLHDPLFVCAIDKGSVADRLGIRGGDTIISVDGQTPADMGDTAYDILIDAGKKTDIIVQRGDKQVELRGDVPASAALPPTPPAPVQPASASPGPAVAIPATPQPSSASTAH